MKTILCYGDSNTYGYNPENGFRYPKGIRWTSVLQRELGSDYTVIEEGCNGRTTIYDDPMEGWKNGKDYLKPCLNSHKPVDIFIMMLGSNDLKGVFKASARDIAEGAAELASTAKYFLFEKQGYMPKIILISPPLVEEGIISSPFNFAFDKTAVERSKAFGDEFERIAKENGYIFFDAKTVAKASLLDSLHLTGASHQALGKAIAKVVLEND